MKANGVRTVRHICAKADVLANFVQERLSPPMHSMLLDLYRFGAEVLRSVPIREVPYGAPGVYLVLRG